MLSAANTADPTASRAERGVLRTGAAPQALAALILAMAALLAGIAWWSLIQAELDLAAHAQAASAWARERDRGDEAAAAMLARAVQRFVALHPSSDESAWREFIDGLDIGSNRPIGAGYALLREEADGRATLPVVYFRAADRAIALEGYDLLGDPLVAQRIELTKAAGGLGHVERIVLTHWASGSGPRGARLAVYPLSERGLPLQSHAYAVVAWRAPPDSADDASEPGIRRSTLIGVFAFAFLAIAALFGVRLLRGYAAASAHVARVSGATASTVRELRVAEARFAAIIRGSATAIIIANDRGAIETFNPAAQRMFACAAAAAIGRPIGDFLPAGERLGSGEGRYTGINRRADGSTFPADASVETVEFDDEQWTLAIVRDLTVQHRAEHALVTTRARLSRAGKVAKLGHYEMTVDPSSGISNASWSAEAAAIFGWMAGDGPLPSIERIDTLVHPDDRARVISALSDAARARAPIDLEYRITSPARAGMHGTPELSPRIIHNVASPGSVLEDGRVNYAGLVHDISERRAAEASAKESELRFLLMADAAPVLMWISDLNGRFSFVNHQWLLFRGRALREERGTGWQAAVHPDDMEPLCAEARLASERGLAFRAEARFQRADGEYRWLLVAGAPQRDLSGQHVGFVGSCVDITDRRNAEATVRQSQADLQRLSDALFAAREDERKHLAREVHDEFGQVVTALRLDVHELARHAAAAGLDDGIVRVHESLDKLAASVRRVLDDLRPPAFDNLGFLGAVAEQLAAIEARYRVRCEVHAIGDPESIPEAIALPLFRVVQEATTNVVRHARAGSILVLIECDAEGVRVSIIDDGVGFDPDPARLRRDAYGLLGMRERLRALHGTLAIESAPGAGTRVRLAVPFEESSPA